MILLINYVCIISTRNGSKTIASTLTSILNQTIKPSLIFVNDDGSTDGTQEVLKMFHDRIVNFYDESRIRGRKDYTRVAYAIDRGIAKTIEVGLKPDFFMITGDDSIYPTDYVERLSNSMRKDNVVIGSGDFEANSSLGDYKAPQGSGRLINWEFYIKNVPQPLPKYNGFESYILYRALVTGNKIKRYQNIRFFHVRNYDSYSLFTFGQAMYFCGYPWIGMLNRIASLISRRQLRHAILLFLGYLQAHIVRYPKCDAETHRYVQNHFKKRLRKKFSSYFK